MRLAVGREETDRRWPIYSTHTLQHNAKFTSDSLNLKFNYVTTELCSKKRKKAFLLLRPGVNPMPSLEQAKKKWKFYRWKSAIFCVTSCKTGHFLKTESERWWSQVKKRQCSHLSIWFIWTVMASVISLKADCSLFVITLDYLAVSCFFYADFPALFIFFCL